MEDGKTYIKNRETGRYEEVKVQDSFNLPDRLIILGKGSIAGKPFTSIKTKEYIPGYDGEVVWTVGTHPIKDADGYLCLHGEDDHGKPINCIADNLELEAANSPLLNNSVAILLLCALTRKMKEVRIAGAPMKLGSEYSEQRESLFQVMGYVKAYGVSVRWDDDVEYNNYYSEKVGIKYV